jgi:helix-turn-helix protein
LKPARRRELARWIRERFGASVQQSCRLALLRRSTWYRRSHAKDQTLLRMRIRELALNRPRFGYLRIHVLLRREGWLINRKRVHRLYRLDGLQVRMRVRRRKRLSLHRGPYRCRALPISTGAWISSTINCSTDGHFASSR